MSEPAQGASALTPTVSVVIPVYNGADTIAACLESLLSQRYPSQAYEIIVVENGSTDDTVRVVQQYPVRLLRSERRGAAAARNLGAGQSEAEIVVFTDADCVADPDWLSELVRPYADAEIGGVGGAILSLTSAEGAFVEQFTRESPPLVNFMSGDYEYLPHLYTGNASYRRRLFNALGGFNDNLITAEDVDLSWRAQLQAGAKVCYAPSAVIHHRYRPTVMGLAREYRQWGFGEILLDTLYGPYPGYPRRLGYQLRRILKQAAALARYAASAALRRVRLARGRATPYEAAAPRLWFLIESSNIWGKLEALAATRLMTDARPVLNTPAETLISRLFPQRK